MNVREILNHPYAAPLVEPLKAVAHLVAKPVKGYFDQIGGGKDPSMSGLAIFGTFGLAAGGIAAGVGLGHLMAGITAWAVVPAMIPTIAVGAAAGALTGPFVVLPAIIGAVCASFTPIALGIGLGGGIRKARAYRRDKKSGKAASLPPVFAPLRNRKIKRMTRALEKTSPERRRAFMEILRDSFNADFQTVIAKEIAETEQRMSGRRIASRGKTP